MKQVEKILGADVELGNIVLHQGPGATANDAAARLLLAEIDGIAGYRAMAGEGANPQDWGRKFLPTNGGCIYIDLGHLETCQPEVCSARDFVAAHHANLRLARAACAQASRKLAGGTRMVVMANNSDRQGQSWGGHLNVMISRDLFGQLFDRLYPSLFVLVAWQVSSIVYTGQGKVGAENGKAWIDFQISQRGDFFECLAAEQTTYRRPLCNTRDEAHAGSGASAAELARLHVIFHDTTLTHGSNYLKAGVTQLVLAMLESGWCDASLMLADPLDALTAWGHDPDLRTLAPLVDGREVSAVEHQQLFAAAARRFVEDGQARHVPEARQILDYWEDTLAKLACRDVESLARRLDWVLKRTLLKRLVDRDPAAGWRSSAVRAADLLFANLDPAEGLYWAVEAAGGVDRLVSNATIDRAMREPPDDTRAWSRAQLLRQLPADQIESVNWDEIRLRPRLPGTPSMSLRLDDPRGFTRAEIQRLAEPETEADKGSAADGTRNPTDEGQP